VSALAQTGSALSEAAAEARAAWSARATAVVVVLTAAALMPLARPGWIRLDALAASLYLALAALGLSVTVGLARLPLLGQGAFMGVGAFATALLRVHAGWGWLGAALAGTAAATAAGALVGLALVRRRPLPLAIGTWLVAWLVFLALLDLPSLSGGAEGLVVPASGPRPAWHYELALALLVLAALGFRVLARGPFGLALSAAGADDPAAAGLGVPIVRLRIEAMTVSAAVAGLAGALTVQLVGVADTSDYGPFLSFKLLAAVLLGGAASALGGPIGIALLAALAGAAHGLGDLEHVATERFDPMLTAILVFGALAVRASGVAPWLDRRGGAGHHPGAWHVPGTEGVRGGHVSGGKLSKRFGSVVAVEDVSLDLPPGVVTALVGPNGSGKTTVVGLIAGELEADRGEVALDGERLAPGRGLRARVERGVVRTLQPTAVFDHLTVVENVLVGAGLRDRFDGLGRTLFRTPKARREEWTTRADALAVCRRFGLDPQTRASDLPAVDRRLLMIACAWATRPRALLLDEPSAGAGPAELPRIAELVRGLARDGAAVLVVEHNLRLVRAVADHVIVLEAGRVLAEGPPAVVAADPAVVTAYLGRARL
jgi:ABC-type branched-subunit amino acid transport system ATPase component/ABC-type branched-subunit amino acid transport system permease subunit